MKLGSVCIIVCFSLFACQSKPPKPEPSPVPDVSETLPADDQVQIDTLGIKLYELPKIEKGEKLIERIAYRLVFDKNHRTAKWVAYQLTKEEAAGKVRRTNNFRIDPDVEGSVGPKDYPLDVYDRGHLAPAGDMAWSKAVMSESFLMSNMAPQPIKFNRGKWNSLEGRVRKWATKYGAVFVVTGPVLNSKLSRLPGSNASIPLHYYKAVLDMESEKPKAIAFVLPTNATAKDLCVYSMPVDEAERITGIDFFTVLPDEVEKKIEGTADCAAWNR